MKRWAKSAGFSLIEIAVVLVVVGLVLSGAVVGLKPVVEGSKTATTNGKLERIELALQAYVMQNGCLPCPADGSLGSSDTNAGWSHSNVAADYYGPGQTGVNTNRPCSVNTTVAATTCATNGGAGASLPVGVVPWRNLGLRESDIVDAWNSRISYAVTPALTQTAGSSMVRSLPANYPAGDLVVADYSNTTNQTAAAAYVLVSHGKDRTGAFGSGAGSTTTLGNVGTYTVANPQGANMPLYHAAATHFRQDTNRPTEGATSYFDDVVRYRTAPNIIRDCGPNACGNPSG